MTSRVSEPLKPRVEQSVGEDIALFGIKAKVLEVVPEDDWSWRVYLGSTDGGGNRITWTIVVPTDYRTTDGKEAWA